MGRHSPIVDLLFIISLAANTSIAVGLLAGATSAAETGAGASN